MFDLYHSLARCAFPLLSAGVARYMQAMQCIRVLTHLPFRHTPVEQVEMCSHDHYECVMTFTVPCSLAWIQEVIVSAAVLGAAVGSAVGGWFSDRVGRKTALLVGDILFTAGALLMAAARSPNALIAGQIRSHEHSQESHAFGQMCFCTCAYGVSKTSVVA